MHEGAISLRDALKEARQLGAEVVPVRRTGEVRVRVPGRPSVTVNNRRKDSSRELTKLLRELRQKARGNR